MPGALVCISPAESHVGPVLALVRALASHGWRVRVLTGHRFADRIRAAGAEPLPLPPEGDVLDDAEATDGPRGIRALNESLGEYFVRPAPAQFAAVREALASEATDVVVGDLTFMGLLLLPTLPDGPPLVMASFFPLAVSSVDTAPFGLGIGPRSDALGRVRNRLLSVLARRLVLARVHRDIDDFLLAHELPGLGGGFLTDAITTVVRPALFAQFTVPGFEYPRSDLPDNVRFFGPLRPVPPAGLSLPDWWPRLDTPDPIVLVSQGTVANTDFDELIAPTIAALARDPVTVVATLGRADGRAVGSLRQVPTNTVVTDFVPYAELMPRVSVFVTNGGYGGVQEALAHGVPMVVAGDTQDKVEVSARIGWSGAGINLRTGRPKAAAIGRAVRRVLADDRYRSASAALAAEIATAPGPAAFVAELEQLVAR